MQAIPSAALAAHAVLAPFAQVEAVERQSDGRALVKVILREVAGDMAAGGVTARAVKQRFALQEA